MLNHKKNQYLEWRCLHGNTVPAILCCYRYDTFAVSSFQQFFP